MTERMYLFFVGAYILVALYLQNNYMIYGLSALLVLEGVTGLRLTRMIQKTRQVSLNSGLIYFNTRARFDIDGLSAWRVS